MNVSGNRCPLCQTPIEPGREAMTCNHCGISYHAECWQENNGCSTDGCPSNTQSLSATDLIQPTRPIVGARSVHDKLNALLLKVRAWYDHQLEEGTFNIRYLILWFMLAIFPLLVIPNHIAIRFAMGVVPPEYVYLPRYIILGIVAIIALIILLKDRTQIKHPAFIPLFFFIIFATVSGFLAPIQITAWIGSPYRFTGLSTYYFCIVLFILATTINKTERLLKAMVYTAAIVSGLGLLQYFGINLVPHGHYIASGMLSYGTMPHPDFFGTYTAFILPAAVFMFLRSKKFCDLLFPVLISIGQIVSLCRGTWVASLIGLLIVIWYVWNRPELRKNLFVLLGAFVVVALALMTANHGLLLSRIFSLKGNYGINLSDSAGSYRMYIWRGAFHLFLLYWPFGIGPDHLVYAGLITPAHELADKAHDIYLEIGLTMGIFTLLSYLALLSFTLRKWKTEIGFVLFTMIAVYLVQGIANIDIVVIMPLFWIVLGLTLGEQLEDAD
jgi:putative inorganic carbon (HCO3(-)) transporter